MWIFVNDAFVSVVKDTESDGMLLMRGRKAGDVQRALNLPGLKEIRLPGRDYMYRASVSREVVAQALLRRLAYLDYPNFKDSVKEDDRHDTYADVWQVMWDWQGKLHPDEAKQHEPRGWYLFAGKVESDGEKSCKVVKFYEDLDHGYEEALAEWRKLKGYAYREIIYADGYGTEATMKSEG